MRSLIALCLLAGGAACAQQYDFSALDRFLTQTATSIPSGFEVMVAQGDRQLYWKQYGAWSKDKQAKIASATKWFSGALIMSLVDDGTLSLDDRASRYLPYLTGEKEPITVRQLMSHTSGYGGEAPLVHPCLGDSSTTLARCAEALAQVPLVAPPGTAFIYSGAGMQVAGRVAEVASGKDWQTLFRERIAGPLGMTATDYEYEGPTANPRISGGGRSTASDSMKFLTMIQQGGVYQGHRVLSARAVATMLSNQVGTARIVDTPAAENWRYGIGNWLEDPDAQGQSLRNSSIGVAGWTPALDRERDVKVVIGMQNPLRPFQPYYAEFSRILNGIVATPPLTPRGVVNAASFEAGPISAGELVTLFGSFGSGAGLEVRMGGMMAPLVYASPAQATVIAPSGLEGRASAEVTVSSSGTPLATVVVPVDEAAPALFSTTQTGSGQAAAFNQDNSPNDAANPARPGTLVQLYGTGGGRLSPLTVDIGGKRAELVWAGSAPGIAGVFQLNVRIPEGVSGAVPVVVRVGTASSLANVTVAVR